MPIHKLIIILTSICFSSGCKPTSQNKTEHEVVYEDEQDIDGFCEVGRSFGSKMCQGKYEIKTYRIDTSEEALTSLKLPVTIKDPTNDFLVGYKNGWKEKSDNNHFYACLHHKQVSGAYTPMMRDNRDKSDDYRKGWQLGWNRASKDATRFSDELTKKIQNQ